MRNPFRSALRPVLALALMLTPCAPAATLYVNVNNPTPVPPFTNWATAATTIQAAVDASVTGDVILVTNGVYQTGTRAVYGMNNRVAMTKPVTVRSVNGPAVTQILGYQVPGTRHGPAAVRCVYMTNGALLVGFTLTNGATQTSGLSRTNQAGGGVWCEGLSAVLSDCVLRGNSANSRGGGAYSGTLNNCTLMDNSAYSYGGGAAYSTLNDCTLTNNSVNSSGGGAYFAILSNCKLTANSAASYGGGTYNSALNNCALTGNSANYYGGGAYSGTLSNCTLTGNSASEKGGGAYTGTLSNCILTANSAYFDGGGAYNGVLNNCRLSGNSAGSYGGGAYSGTLNNCTLTGNSAGGNGGGAASATLNNCILYYNRAGFMGNNHETCTLRYCCSTSLPTGMGNLANEPSFENTNDWSNLRLHSNSPCINAGTNFYVTTIADLDGLPRIVKGRVDMGAYEWQEPVRLAAQAPPGPGGLAWNLTGETGRVYALHASSNLTAWSWLAWLTNLPGQSTWTNPLTPLPPARFYKAVPVP